MKTNRPSLLACLVPQMIVHDCWQLMYTYMPMLQPVNAPAIAQGERPCVLTCDIDCEFVEGMHGSMQLDIALGAMHHALPGGCSHADAVSQAGHLLWPISAEHKRHLLMLHQPCNSCTLMGQHQHCVPGNSVGFGVSQHLQKIFKKGFFRNFLGFSKF